jgi:futalosine hydrolase
MTEILANVNSIDRNVKLIFEICRMQILVVSATNFEIAPFLSQNPSADFLITGVGVPACIYQLFAELQKKRYDLVIQAGIGGSFGNLVPLGQTVTVERDVFADLGAIANNQLSSLFDMGFADRNQWPFREGWLVNDSPILGATSLQKVPGATVNTISDRKDVADLYAQHYNPAMESMEGAAFHYVCLMQKTNFIQLRAASNTVGERDKSKWKMREAIEHLNQSVAEVIRTLDAHF